MSSPPAVLEERTAPISRIVPSMGLSDGSATSQSPAPTTPIATDAATGARNHFSVHGNAVVTGGVGTLGLKSCDALLEHGLTGLMIFDINLTESSSEIQAMREKFPHAKIAAMTVDVTAEDKVAEAMEETVRILGSIEHLVCFVGLVGCVETLEMPVSQWRQILDINTTGSFIFAQAAARQMVKQSTGTGGRSITFIASTSAHRVDCPQPRAAYNVNKAAVLMLTSCLAAEWARYGIRTNSVSPGYTDTVLNERDGIKEHRGTGIPGKLAEAVVLLASSAGSYINGADIAV
ncbi:oxidoreductase [Aspergillus granulosus]|uniref:Oxidoreductase n=1 Tax=Aspergillus granulosus TaxID=176169 RepID=A0ABR4I196_9EURO